MDILYNVYCDESCHLENDGINDMALGAVWCSKDRIYEISEEIKEIKKKYQVLPSAELKWTKIGPVKKNLYMELLNYFFDSEYLHFRCLVVPDKKLLDHSRFHQTHDDWYYKMYFDMLKVILDPHDSYEIYIDIKDSNSYKKTKKLKEICCNNIYDFSGKVIKRIQPVRSNEIQIMQIVDVLIGAVCYTNRIFPKDFKKSETKLEIIHFIKEKSGYQLNKSTPYKEDKFNIFIWDARQEFQDEM